MFKKLVALFFDSNKSVGSNQPSKSNSDITQHPLFAVMDYTVRFMIVEREQKIREYINLGEQLANQGHYESAAWQLAELRHVDYLNSGVYHLERIPELIFMVKSFDWPVDSLKVDCAFRRVYANPKWGKDNFELTEHGYKTIITSNFMPNRADSLGESWRERQKTNMDQTYFDMARSMIYYYSLIGFGTVTHPSQMD